VLKGDGAVGGQEGAAFLRRAGLPDDVLTEVWRLACGGRSRPQLHKDEWFVACRFVSLAQAGHIPLNMAMLFSEPKVPFPDFGLFHTKPEFETEISQPFPKSACHVRVTNPSVVGQGMNKHVKYTLSMRTTLPHFLRPQTIVVRRYSDFRWLHTRMRTRYPGTLIPPLPEKRYFGNMSSSFVEERRLALEQYINYVARHPMLTQCPELMAMLDASVEGFKVFCNMVDHHSTYDLSGFPSSASGAIDDISSENEESASESNVTPTATADSTSWISRIVQKVENTSFFSKFEDSAVSNAQMERELAKLGIKTDVIETYRKELGAYSKRLHSVSSVVEHMIAARRARGYELARIGAYMASLARVEATFTPAKEEGQYEVKELEWISAQEFFENISGHFDKVSNHTQDINDKVSVELSTPLRYQLGKVHAMKEVLKNHDHCILDLRKSFEGLESAKKYFASARARNLDVDGATARVKAAQAHIENMQAKLQRLHNSVNLEMGKYRRERAVDMRSLLVDFAKADSQGATSTQDLLQPLLKISSDNGDHTLLEASKFRTQAFSKELPPWFLNEALK